MPVLIDHAHQHRKVRGEGSGQGLGHRVTCTIATCTCSASGCGETSQSADLLVGLGVWNHPEAANVAYKLLSRLGGAQTIGPVLLGLDAPVHVLQAGDDVDEVVSIAAMAVMDASR